MEGIQDSLFGKTSLEHCQATTDEILGQSLKNCSKPKFQYLNLQNGLKQSQGQNRNLFGQTQGWLEGTGIVLRGESLTRNIGESLNVVVESSLSQILEANVPEKYYLSSRACQGILRRAEARGKKLPPLLDQALRAQADVPEQEDKLHQQYLPLTERNGTATQEQTQGDHFVIEPIKQIAQCLTSGTGRRYDPESETLVVLPKTVGCLTAEGSDSNNAHGHKGFCTNQVVDAGHIIVEPVTQFGDKAGTLTARHDSSPCADRGMNILVQPQLMKPIAFTERGRKGGRNLEWQNDVMYCLTSPGEGGRTQSRMVAQPIAFNGRQDPVSGMITGALDTDRATQCIMYPVAYPEIASPLLAKGNLSYRGDMDNLVSSVDCRNLYENKELSGILQSKQGGGHSLNYQNPVRIGYLVRRLTPVECERLQGLEDDYTAGGSDSARYKAIGNSMAKPCPGWIQKQIVKISSLPHTKSHI